MLTLGKEYMSRDTTFTLFQNQKSPTTLQNSTTMYQTHHMSYIHVMHTVHIDIKWFCGNFGVPHSVLLRPQSAYLLCNSCDCYRPAPPLSLSPSRSSRPWLLLDLPLPQKIGFPAQSTSLSFSFSRLPRIQSSPRIFLAQIPRVSRVYRSAQLLLRPLLNLSLSLRHVLEAYSSICLLTCK